VAKLLFSSLFKSIFDEIEKEKTEKEAETLVTMINQALNEMLSNTLLFLPPFLGFILVSRPIRSELRSNLSLWDLESWCLCITYFRNIVLHIVIYIALLTV